MKWIYEFEKVITKLANLFQKGAIFLLFFMMVITVIDIIGRFFLSPMRGTFEITNFTLALIVFLSLSYAQVNKDHITMDLLFEKFPKPVQRLVNILWYSIMFVILLILAWQTFQYSLRMAGSASAELQLPISLILIIASLGILLYALSSFVDLLKSIHKVVESIVPRSR